MTPMFGHVNMKQRLETEEKSWDRARGDEKPHGAGGMELGRQQELLFGFLTGLGFPAPDTQAAQPSL